MIHYFHPTLMETSVSFIQVISTLCPMLFDILKNSSQKKFVVNMLTISHNWL